MSFADTEARATAAVFRRLVNAEATFSTPEGDVVGGVVFDAALGTTFNEMGVQTLEPSFMMTPDIAPLVAEGDDVQINSAQLSVMSVAYRVRSVTPLAEGGMQRVVLARL